MSFSNNQIRVFYSFFFFYYLVWNLKFWLYGLVSVKMSALYINNGRNSANIMFQNPKSNIEEEWFKKKKLLVETFTIIFLCSVLHTSLLFLYDANIFTRNRIRIEEKDWRLHRKSQLQHLALCWSFISNGDGPSYSPLLNIQLNPRLDYPYIALALLE